MFIRGLGIPSKRKGLRHLPNDRLKKEDIDRLIEDLTEELSEGFTDARMTLDFFDSIGEWLYKQVYYIDSELRWERSY